jgi:hypothetical protein
MWDYINVWKDDPKGPWWEADLIMDMGRVLKALPSG